MTENLNVVLFKSRNKDNEHLENFNERTNSFLTNKTADELTDAFNTFTKKGEKGELSRFYFSVNNRDNNKVRKALLHFLLDHEDYNMSKLENKLVSLASKKENSKENKWLFDFDEKDKHLASFLRDLNSDLNENEVKVHKTPTGHAIVVDHGFDTRELLKKWKNVELKRDDLLCYKWQVNH